jgi:hypothetical protein
MIEYKVREVTRYIVTRWEDGTISAFVNGNTIQMPSGKKSSQHGEFDNAEMAYAAFAIRNCPRERPAKG